MKFSWDFLKEFLDLNISPQEAASKLTMSGLEVVSLKKHGKDTVFEVEVTANRPDLLSVAGIAYDLAALIGKKPGIVKDNPVCKPLLNIAIEIEDKTDCPFYVARLIGDVKVGPSPEWLKNILSACGVNSINNIVDITNYCMLKWGQPLHAFDLRKIKEKIAVRRAKPKEVLMCIDNKERILNPEALVIADKDSILALAGIVGGKDSEVTDYTTDVLLEAAVFSPLATRRSRTILGINTDSSYRFERQVNPFYLEKASWEAVVLMRKIAGGKFKGYKKAGLKPVPKRPLINFDSLRMSRFLGANIKEGKALKILKNLDFQIRKDKKKITVKPPFFRPDVKTQEDVFEEVVRIWGYQNIPHKLPEISRKFDEPESFYKFKEKIRDKAVRLGFQEIMTYSVVSKGNLLSCQDTNGKPSSCEQGLSSLVKIVNPLREGEDILRPSIFVGMVQAFVNNVYRKQRSLEFFEIADSYARAAKSFKETTKLCFGFHKDNLDDFSVFKARIEEFLRECGIQNNLFIDKDHSLFLSFSIVKDFGWLGVLNPEACRKLDLKSVFLAEFDLGLLFGRVRPALFKEINYLPWVERDISLAVRRDVKFKEIEKIINEQTNRLLKDFEIIDVYKGEKLGKDLTGFTLRISYQHKDRTLKAQEVDSLHFKLRDALAKKEGVVLR